jgi:protein CpxP
MNRKLALLAVGGALLIATAVLAQGSPSGQQPAPQAPAQQPSTPGAAAPNQGAPLGKLGLSDDQKKQIHDIRQQTQQHIESVRNDSSLSPQQKRDKIRELHRTADQSIDGVLTPEQRKKYDAWRKAHRRHHRHPPPPAAHP